MVRIIRMIWTSRMIRTSMMIVIMILSLYTGRVTENGVVIFRTHHDVVIHTYVDKHYTSDVVGVDRNSVMCNTSLQ